MWTGQHVKRWIENILTKYVNPEDMHKKYKTKYMEEIKSVQSIVKINQFEKNCEHEISGSWVSTRRVVDQNVRQF